MSQQCCTEVARLARRLALVRLWITEWLTQRCDATVRFGPGVSGFASLRQDYRLDGRVEVIACGSDGEVSPARPPARGKR